MASLLTLVPPYTAYPTKATYTETARIGEPAIVLRERGQSRLVYFPGDVGRTAWRSGHPDVTRLMQNAVNWMLRGRRPVRGQPPHRSPYATVRQRAIAMAKGSLDAAGIARQLGIRQNTVARLLNNLLERQRKLSGPESKVTGWTSTVTGRPWTPGAVRDLLARPHSQVPWGCPGGNRWVVLRLDHLEGGRDVLGPVHGDHALAQAGARLVVVDKDPDLAADIAKEVDATPWSGDATDRAPADSALGDGAITVASFGT